MSTYPIADTVTLLRSDYDALRSRAEEARPRCLERLLRCHLRREWGDEAFTRYDRRQFWAWRAIPEQRRRASGIPCEINGAGAKDFLLPLGAEFLRLKDSEPTFTPLADWPADTPLGVYRDALTKYNAEKKAWRERKDLCQGLSWFTRYSVGTQHGIFSESKGHGDSWEDALRKAGAL